MSDRCFVDTNVLVYAHDSSTGRKHTQAQALIEKLWDDGTGVISTQVLQELRVTLQRKVSPPLDWTEAAEIIEDYLTWHLVVNDGRSILEAMRLEKQFRISFWDALIVQAADAAGAEVLYSEDLSHGQVFGKIRVVNPLQSLPAKT